MRRLVDVVGIDIKEGDKKALTNLAKTRNALQHWGLTESASAVETRAADVLDFLIRFLDDQLLKELADGQLAEIEDDVLRVREGLTGIKAYVKSRMDRLRSELKDVAHSTVKCPDCAQFALVVAGGERKCHFCPRLWDGDELPQEYATEVLNFSWHDIKQGADPIVVECPNCDLETLVLGTLTADHPDRPISFCFNCAETFRRPGFVRALRSALRPHDQELICEYCWSDLSASN